MTPIYLGDRIQFTNHRGRILFADPDNVGMTTHYIRGAIWQEDLTRLWESIIKPGMTVLDIGANIGWFAMIAADLVGASGIVHAFEPSPITAPFLYYASRCQPEGHRIKVWECAVGEKDGETTLWHYRRYSGGSSCYRPVTETVKALYDEVTPYTVKMIDIDGLNLSDVGAIKIDAQGAEPGIFKGMSETLARSPNVKIICEWFPGEMEQMGYDIGEFIEYLFSNFKVHTIDGQAVTIDQIEKLPNTDFYLWQ